MKVYVMTKAVPLQAEEFVDVKKSKKEAEKAFRDKFPYMRKSQNFPGSTTEVYTSQADVRNGGYMLFIHEKEI